jgi:hypothetical protein
LIAQLTHRVSIRILFGYKSKDKDAMSNRETAAHRRCVCALLLGAMDTMPGLFAKGDCRSAAECTSSSKRTRSTKWWH